MLPKIKTPPRAPANATDAPSRFRLERASFQFSRIKRPSLPTSEKRGERHGSARDHNARDLPDREPSKRDDARARWGKEPRNAVSPTVKSETGSAEAGTVNAAKATLARMRAF